MHRSPRLFRALGAFLLLLVTLGFASRASAQTVAVYGATSSSQLTEIQGKLTGTGEFTRVDVFGANAVTPTVATLQTYDAVLVFSNNGFLDSAAMGNNLADYVDGGGGVVVATFAFWSSGIGLAGRFKDGGYSPFTFASQSSGTNLTLVADDASHPILQGVSSFDGGTSSYHNSVLAMANGATQVAHWSNGQPLVGALNKGAGRTVGLNFFPPSSDSQGGGWVATTNGARLMANALTWAAEDSIQVAVETQPSSTGEIALLVSQLNDSHLFHIQATSVPATSIDTDAELAAYDVVLFGSSGAANSTDITEAAGARWASRSASGALGFVTVGWGVYISSAFVPGSTTVHVGDVLAPVLPYTPGYPSGHTYCSPATLTISNSNHPVTTGVSTFLIHSMDGTSNALKSGSSTLGTSSCSSAKSVVVGNNGTWDPLESTCRHASLSIL